MTLNQRMPRVSPTGFLIGAVLVLAAGAVKILVLDGLEARQTPSEEPHESPVSK